MIKKIVVGICGDAKDLAAAIFAKVANKTLTSNDNHEKRADEIKTE